MEWEELADDPRKPFASVKFFSSTFDAIHPRTMSQLLNASSRRGPLFFQIYGQSEVGPAVGRAYFRRLRPQGGRALRRLCMPGRARGSAW